VGLVSAIFRNVLGKPGAADFRDSAEHFVRVLREQGIVLGFGKEELLFADDLVDRLKEHREFKDAAGCWLGEVLVRSFAGEWVPGHALGPAVRVANASGARHLFPLGWVYRRADGGAAESIAQKCHRDLGFPEDPVCLGRFTDEGERIAPGRESRECR
jgi:hypothetical protein